MYVSFEAQNGVAALTTLNIFQVEPLIADPSLHFNLRYAIRHRLLPAWYNRALTSLLLRILLVASHPLTLLVAASCLTPLGFFFSGRP